MAFWLTSMVVAAVTGYFITQLFEISRIKVFQRRHPAIAAVLVSLLLVALVIATLILYSLAGQTVEILHIQLLTYAAIYLMGVVVPLSIILRRMGVGSLWAIAAFVPFAQIVGLWVLALKRWPITQFQHDSFDHI